MRERAPAVGDDDNRAVDTRHEMLARDDLDLACRIWPAGAERALRSTASCSTRLVRHLSKVSTSAPRPRRRTGLR